MFFTNFLFLFSSSFFYNKTLIRRSLVIKAKVQKQVFRLNSRQVVSVIMVCWSGLHVLLYPTKAVAGPCVSISHYLHCYIPTGRSSMCSTISISVLPTLSYIMVMCCISTACPPARFILTPHVPFPACSPVWYRVSSGSPSAAPSSSAPTR